MSVRIRVNKFEKYSLEEKAVLKESTLCNVICREITGYKLSKGWWEGERMSKRGRGVKGRVGGAEKLELNYINF